MYWCICRDVVQAKGAVERLGVYVAVLYRNNL